MKNFRFVVWGLILSLIFIASSQKVWSQNPKISASTIPEDLRALQDKTPQITPRELADHGNQLLAKQGLTFVFDACKSLKENGKKLPSKAELFFQPHLIQLKTVGGQNQTFEIAANYPLEIDVKTDAKNKEHGCFTQLAVSKINSEEMTVIADGKPFRLQRPKDFRLGKVILYEKATQKIIRQWETPLPIYPLRVSSDEKKLYMYIHNVPSELIFELSDNGTFQFRVSEEIEKDFISMSQRKRAYTFDTFANQDFTIINSLSAYTSSEEIYPLEIKTFSQKNPTFYEFDFPVSVLRSKLLRAFENFDLLESLTTSFDYDSELIISVDSKENALFSKEMFANPENKNDLNLHFDGLRVGYSPIYFGNGYPLEYYAEFQLHLTEAGNNRTKVSVITHKPRVINGSKCCSSHGYISNAIAVEPTTIEEYHILRLIGGILGAKNMPPLVTPEIVETPADKQKKLEIDEFVRQANQTFEKSKKILTSKPHSFKSPSLSYSMKGKEVETLVANFISGNVLFKESYYFKNKKLVYATQSEDYKFEGKTIRTHSLVYYLKDQKLFDYSINYHNKPQRSGTNPEIVILEDSFERLEQLNQLLSPKRKGGLKK